LKLNSWITIPHLLINNIFGYIFDGNFLQVGGSFWGNIKNNEISKNFQGGSFLCK
jgi:hypothetical protein